MGSCSGRCTLLVLCALQLVSPGARPRHARRTRANLRRLPGATAWTRAVAADVRRCEGVVGAGAGCRIPAFRLRGRGRAVLGRLGQVSGSWTARNKSLRAGPPTPTPRAALNKSGGAVRGTLLRAVPSHVRGRVWPSVRQEPVRACARAAPKQRRAASVLRSYLCETRPRVGWAREWERLPCGPPFILAWRDGVAGSPGCSGLCQRLLCLGAEPSRRTWA
jgi:hypothetical protein